MKRLDYDEMSVELQDIYDEYLEVFGGYPDGYAQIYK